MSERDQYSDHQSGMPNAAYFRMVAEQEYAWNHRGEPDPMEGFPDHGIIDFTAQTAVEIDGQINREYQPKEGPVA